jgi:hypothetical protein
LNLPSYRISMLLLVLAVHHSQRCSPRPFFHGGPRSPSGAGEEPEPEGVPRVRSTPSSPRAIPSERDGPALRLHKGRYVRARSTGSWRSRTRSSSTPSTIPATCPNQAYPELLLPTTHKLLKPLLPHGHSGRPCDNISSS